MKSGTKGIGKGIRAVAGLALLMAAPLASADILYEQAPVDGGGALLTGENLGYELQYADAFDVTGPGWRVDSISWWGGFSALNGPGGDPDPFDIRIYVDDDGAPSPTETVASFADVQPEVTETGGYGDLSLGMSNNSDLHIGVQQFTLELQSPLALDTGRYYLGVNNPGSNVTFNWLMSHPAETGAWFRTGNPSDWIAQEYSFAHNFTGRVIPEPATMTLLGIGLAGLGLRRWRRRGGCASAP